MKTLKLLIAMLLTFGLCSSGFSQQTSVPHAIKYQAVARDSKGDMISNQNVSFRISIVQGNESGLTVYQETQNTTTNQFGLATLSIGKGIVVSGNFTDIQWGIDSYFVKVEFDPKGGSDFSLMGVSQMMSVPYALYSERSGSTDNFPVRAALQGTNLATPLTKPENGMLVYNTDTAGSVPNNVIPGYYFNAGTPVSPNWVLLGSAAKSGNVGRIMALGTNTSYGGLVQDATGFIGSAVGSCNTGANNTAFGDSAMNSAMTNNNNTTIGYFSERSLTSGHDNTGAGSKALYNTTSGYDNTADGAYSLFHNTTGNKNTALGDSALYNNTTGLHNTATGYGAITTTSASGTISGNTANGYNALHNDSADYNTGIGDSALFSDTYGYDNVAVGYQASALNTKGYLNTAMGYKAMYNNTVTSQNVAIGYEALYTQSSSTAFNSYNTALGTYALFSNNPSASSNGYFNTASGVASMYSNSTGYYNTASGVNSMRNNTTGTKNTATGVEALYGGNVHGVTTGNFNSAYGCISLYNNYTGLANSSVGDSSLYNNTSGDSNTAEGVASLVTNTTGNCNTGLGYDADVNSGGLNNVTVIGCRAKGTASNSVVLGNTAVTSIGGYAPWSNLSDSRFKKNIEEEPHGLDFILKLRPVTYNMDISGLNNFMGINDMDPALISNKESIRYDGFLAQEVEQAANSLKYNFSGLIKPETSKDHYRLSYEEFVVPLVKAVQELNTKNEDLARENADLKAQLESQKNEIEELKQSVNSILKVQASIK